MFIEIAGHRCFAVSFGSGPRTFLAHSGWIGTYEDWLPTLEVLSRNWRAISYDHRGAGETAVPVEEITYEALLDDLFRVMDRFDVERCVLGGFSAGTSLTLGAVMRAPQRFEGLVLLSGSGGVRAPELGSPGPRMPPSAWPGEDHRARMRWFIERCTPEPDVEHIRRWGHHFLMRAEPEAAERLWAIQPSLDDSFIAQLRTVTIPTLIICGTQDAMCPVASAEYLASLLPNSELVLLEGSGHLPAMIRPLDVASAISRFCGR